MGDGGPRRTLPPESNHRMSIGLVLLLVSAWCLCDAFPPPPSPPRQQAAAVKNQCAIGGEKRIGRSVNTVPNMSSQSEDGPGAERGDSVAFLGNSIIYYNDTPRFLVNLGRGSLSHQDSCLRGGTNLFQLWQLGNGMKRHGFATEAARIETPSSSNEASDAVDMYDVGAPNVRALLDRGEKHWDYVVFNDHTQGPAREASRKATQDVLLEKYLPLLLENNATPIFIETAAYRYPDINNSRDLGSTHEFQKRVREGIETYVQALDEKMASKSIRSRIAPVGTAYLHVHENNHPLWQKLFDPYDFFHPSPSGTFLQGCVLHCTMFGTPPILPSTDDEIAILWRDARMMHNVRTGENVPLPSVEEAEYLWSVAKKLVCTEGSMM